MTRESGMRHAARTGAIATLVFLIAAPVLQAQTATPTHTRLSVETREVDGKTIATFHTTVSVEDGTPVKGVVTLLEQGTASLKASPARGRELTSAALDSEGRAEIVLDALTPGEHSVRAQFSGDSLNASSASGIVSLHPQVTGTPDFALVVAPTSLTIAAPGDAGGLLTTITPSNGFTGFISLSCSGTGGTTTLPVGLSCTFTPLNVQVTGPTSTNPTGAVTAALSIQTSAPQQTGSLRNSSDPRSSGRGRSRESLALAMLLPGIAGLGFLARKHKRLASLAMLLLFGSFAMIGLNGCAARYRYLNHGPVFGGTPAGTYNITVTAQTSNGVAATSHSIPLALTVK